jgi:protoporphyrinogen oxidase
MTARSDESRVMIIGAGFCGLAAAYELSKRGVSVTIFERDAEIGGLAGSFQSNGVRLEKFYHHWFTSDEHVMALIDELGTQDQIAFRPTRTGMYYANNFFKLSTPYDVLRFTPLPLVERFRLGLLALRAQRVREWRHLENLTAAEWLRQMGGNKAYEVVWEPLLRGKFGEYASEISAVWIWSKLKLRGGSRGKGGEERLAYYRGGFAALADQIAARIEATGGRIAVGKPVNALVVDAGKVIGVEAAGEKFKADAVIATPALPVIANLTEPYVPREYVEKLRRIKYLSNICLVLQLEKPLSSTYWLNVNDPDSRSWVLSSIQTLSPKKATVDATLSTYRSIFRIQIRYSVCRTASCLDSRFLICRGCSRSSESTGSSPTTFGEPATPSQWWSENTATYFHLIIARWGTFFLRPWLRFIPKIGV